jgi:hypothetical protein
MSTTIRILEGVALFLLYVAIISDGLKGLAGSSVRTVRSKPAATPLCESVPLCSGVEFEEAIGRLRGGRTSKIHPLADDRGRPVAFALTQRKPRRRRYGHSASRRRREAYGADSLRR